MHDLSSMRALFVGGAAVPQSMIEAFQKRHGLRVIHAWGMTETTPLGTVSHVPAELAGAADAVDVRAARHAGPAVAVRGDPRAQRTRARCPGTAATMGELEVRGPWVASGYYNREDAGSLHRRRLVPHGRHRHDRRARGYVRLQDRAKDLIKSGGEWISSVALEYALMGHPAVAEAAVIGVASREMDGASAGRRRAQAGRVGRSGRTARVSRPAVSEILAAGRVRVCRGDPANVDGEVSEE